MLNLKKTLTVQNMNNNPDIVVLVVLILLVVILAVPSAMKLKSERAENLTPSALPTCLDNEGTEEVGHPHICAP